MLMELPVNGCGVNGHIRMGFLQGDEAFGAGQSRQRARTACMRLFKCPA